MTRVARRAPGRSSWPACGAAVFGGAPEVELVAGLLDEGVADCDAGLMAGEPREGAQGRAGVELVPGLLHQGTQRCAGVDLEAGLPRG
eukprot:6014783-Alexandrium_andersonii.AAC.1